MQQISNTTKLEMGNINLTDSFTYTEEYTRGQHVSPHSKESETVIVCS